MDSLSSECVRHVQLQSACPQDKQQIHTSRAFVVGVALSSVSVTMILHGPLKMNSTSSLQLPLLTRVMSCSAVVVSSVARTVVCTLSLSGTGTFGRVVLAKHLPTRSFSALKIMTISEVIRLKQVEHVNNEKEILSSISHPFIVNV